MKACVNGILRCGFHPSYHIRVNPLNLSSIQQRGTSPQTWLTKIDLGDGFAGKHVLDLGAGNGVLGIGAAFLGAQHVTMVECDSATVEVLENNVSDVEGESICTIIGARINGNPLTLELPVDMVVMNPPWGVQTLRARQIASFSETIFATGYSLSFISFTASMLSSALPLPPYV